MNNFVSMLAIAGLIASPASASVRDAAFADSGDRSVARTSTFAGVSYRVGLETTTGKPTGVASLQLAAMTHASGSAQMRFSDGLQLRAGKSGKPALHLAGQDIGELNRKAELDGTGTALVIGGVVLLAVIVAVVASDIHHKNKCSEEEDC